MLSSSGAIKSAEDLKWVNWDIAPSERADLPWALIDADGGARLAYVETAALTEALRDKLDGPSIEDEYDRGYDDGKDDGYNQGRDEADEREDGVRHARAIIAALAQTPELTLGLQAALDALDQELR